ncbi:MAG: Rpn family recombination-promoting nuclease/putative transposase [Lachnospiraceae bacterium]|nr:Rpn family recombination-promoting nuclease/putative transposase [Lachnospiraceae bacterium]
MAKKTLQEQTIRDNYLFAAAMMDGNGENSRAFLSCLLGKEIRRVEISYEKSIVYHPEQKGIRLDVYCADETNTRYNVEMQVIGRKILKRARYYHSQIDMELLLAGMEYEELPDSFVIFICDFDPFGGRKYRYTTRTRLEEMPDEAYDDGVHTIFLSTKGENGSEVPKELKAFLKFVGAGLEASEADYESDLVRQFQRSIRKIKADREMRSKYMLFEEMMRDEYKAGKAEGRADYLSELICRNKAKGRTVAEIAEFLNEDVDRIAAIYETCDAPTEDTKE